MPKKLSEPHTISQMENQFTVDFAVSNSFIISLNSIGEVFVYDDCMILMKLSSVNEVKAIGCCKDLAYGIEKNNNILYE